MKRLLLGALLVPALMLGSCLAHDRSGEQMATVSPTPSVGASDGPTGRPADRSASRVAPGQATTLVASPQAVGDPYADLARQLNARGVDIWFEADLVKRWLEGPAAFQEGLDRLGQLATVPGVKGFKVADELGYQDGLTSPAEAEQFLRDVRTGLAQRAPDAQVLIDVVVPDLGCLGWTADGSTSCAEQAVASAPAASAEAVGGYLRAGLVDRLDVSTSLLDEWTYHKWGMTLASAQREAWSRIDQLGWDRLTTLQARKALAEAGGWQGSPEDADHDAHTYVEIPVQAGAAGVDVWTWRQEYDGQRVGLLDDDLATNALWSRLRAEDLHGAKLFTHMTPSLLPSDGAGRTREYDRVAELFGAVFVAAGTG